MLRKNWKNSESGESTIVVHGDVVLAKQSAARRDTGIGIPPPGGRNVTVRRTRQGAFVSAKGLLSG